MPGLIDPYSSNKIGNIGPTNKSITSASGTIFIDNTSFSGVDIKVVAHIYDPQSAALYRYKALLNDSEQTDRALAEARSNLSALRAKLETVHSATPEEDNILRQISHETQQITSLDKAADSLRKAVSNQEIQATVGSVLPLGTLQTLSISTNRDKRDVRSLGHVGPKGRTRGPRSVAGTMVFTVFDRHPLYDLMSLHASEFDGVKYTPALSDQMPPVDLTIVFASEYGHLSRMSIYGVDFATDGKVLSVQDILTEQTLSYYAYDIDPMRSVAQRRIDENYHLMNEWTGIKASSLIFEEDYQNTKSELDPFERFIRRQDPFV